MKLKFNQYVSSIKICVQGILSIIEVKCPLSQFYIYQLFGLGVNYASIVSFESIISHC